MELTINKSNLRSIRLILRAIRLYEREQSKFLGSPAWIVRAAMDDVVKRNRIQKCLTHRAHGSFAFILSPKQWLFRHLKLLILCHLDHQHRRVYLMRRCYVAHIIGTDKTLERDQGLPDLFPRLLQLCGVRCCPP